MGRTTWTIIALAGLAVGAVFLAKGLLSPASEQVERRKEVLNDAARPRVQECRVLEDNELPEGIAPPNVGEDILYLHVTVFYPAFATVPQLKEHALEAVNGTPEGLLAPVHTDEEADEHGAYALLTFRTSGAFTHARLVRAGEILDERVSPE